LEAIEKLLAHVVVKRVADEYVLTIPASDMVVWPV